MTLGPWPSFGQGEHQHPALASPTENGVQHIQISSRALSLMCWRRAQQRGLACSLPATRFALRELRFLGGPD